MAWWDNKGIASINNVPQDKQQYFSGNDWRSQMQPMNAGWSNTNQAPNALQADIADVAANTSQEQFDEIETENDDNVPGMRKKAIDYNDSPVNFMMRQNHPRRFDPLVNAKNFTQELPGNIKNKLGNFKDSLSGGFKNIKDSLGGGLRNILDNTLFGKFAAMNDATNPNAFNYNPQLQGQIDFMEGQGKYGNNYSSGLPQIQSGALAGKNLQSLFGSNDLTEMYENQIGNYQNTYNNMEKQWGNTLDEKELAAKKALYKTRFLDPAKLEQANAIANQNKIDAERTQNIQNIQNRLDGPYDQAANIAGGGGGNTARNAQGQNAREATAAGTGTAQGYSQHYAKGGRIGYFFGGRVSFKNGGLASIL